MSGLFVRPAAASDRDAVFALTPRLADFGPPRWRTAAEIHEAETPVLRRFFDGGAPDDALFVAGRDGAVEGYVFLEAPTDYFTGARHGHVSILAVDRAAEGQGIGGALMRRAEEWARERGYAKLTLNVFALNAAARAMYEHLGYEAETVKYVKLLE